ncbi:MAG TPA: zf-TFIIB domain-containing protein [Myxococcaceae bacterium]|jgi:Zn-finger nucleic acid-binding protein
MRTLFSQLAQLVGDTAETVAKHAKVLSGQPPAPQNAPASEPAPAAESLVHLVSCDSCRAQYDVTGYSAQSLRCRCGHLVKMRAPAVVQRPIQRCGACGGPLKDGTHACSFCGGQVEQDARQLSLICPECFAANPRRGQFCRGCGVALAPEPVGATTPTLHDCPVCAKPLFQRKLAGAWVEECSDCHGLFIAAAQFEHLVVQASRTTAPVRAPAPSTVVAPVTTAVVYRRCPECKQHMQRRNFRRVSGVVVDECKLHGTWLDANELEAIGRFLSSGEQAQAPRLEARQTQSTAEGASPNTSRGRTEPPPEKETFLDSLVDDVLDWGD